MPAVHRDQRMPSIVSGFTAALVLVIGALVMPGPGRWLDDRLYDTAQRSAAPLPAADVAVISVDDASQARLGQWPWPRSFHATLIDRLHASGARVIAFATPLPAAPQGRLDRLRAAISLLQSSDTDAADQPEELRRLLRDSTADVDEDELLAQAMTRHGNVVLAIQTGLHIAKPAAASSTATATLHWEDLPYADAETLGLAIPAAVVGVPEGKILAAAAGVGHDVLQPEPDGVVRRDIAAVRIMDYVLPSLAVSTAALALDGSQPVRLDGRTLTLGAKQFPLDGLLSVRPQYFADGIGPIPVYSFWEVLSGKVPAERFAGRTVLIGFAGAGSTGSVRTPVETAAAPVLVSAATVRSLLNDDLYTRPAWTLAVETLAAVAVVTFAVLGLAMLGVGLGALASALVVALLLATEIGLLNSTGLWLNLALPAMAALLAYAAFIIAILIRGRLPQGKSAVDNPDSLRMLGLTFQGQGQLDLAFETFRRCPLDAPTMDLLYRLAQDYERRRKLRKAAAVYDHMAGFDPDYRDIATRREQLRNQPDATQPLTRQPLTRPVPGADPVPTITPAPDVDVARSHAETLGRYEIERELGKGAMGVVYLGRDPKINRVVAIKAIPLAEEFQDENLAEVRARFFREAEMAGRLNHPGIVTVYDAGEDRGLAYIAMEYLRGEHLSHYADPARLLPVNTVLMLVARVADALNYAHRQNVVHRDIKPANIMFNRETEELKITDFGIARLTDVSRTKTGIVLGTPSFMSPEQLEGRALDGRSDLFALGVTLYHLLAGQLPFRADSMTRLMQKIATEPHAPIRSMRPELPEAVEGILERALAKSVEDRYQTGAEMAEALRACVRSVAA